MKHYFLTFLLLLCCCVMYSIPAKRGVWNIIKLANGKTVRAELCGDEFCHYWKSEDGQCFISKGATGIYEAIDAGSLIKKSQARRAAVAADRAKRSPMYVAPDGRKNISYNGVKKGLIILVEFSDMPFSQSHTRDLYDQIANAENFSNEMGFRASVRDYFYDQSYGQFTLDFDVVGPIRMPNGYEYYGANSKDGGDDGRVIGQMVIDACIAANSQYDIDFKDYDWNNDGDVDQVFILYAGHAEASYPDPNTIWPHEWNLVNAMAEVDENGYVIKWGDKLEVDGVYVNTYACGSELGSNGIDGIGTICHEFSHCLGLPDMYDTQGNGFGMGKWSLMSAGNYNGNSFMPAAYTAYERMYSGWLTPIELTEACQIEKMKGINLEAVAYIIKNEGFKNEYYLLENHDGSKWDSELPGSGLMITHVDYNSTIWSRNVVNSEVGQSSIGISNTHDRCTIIPASNKKSDTQDDLWPYKSINSLTNSSLPAAAVYNRNSDGSYFMNKPIRNITKNDDGTISFAFGEDERTYLFMETFDKCKSKGGNDGIFNGMSSGTVLYDNDGWEANNSTAAYLCARFGSKNLAGQVKTPIINISGENILSFRAAPFTGQAKTITINVAEGSASISTPSFTLVDNEWTVIETKINGNGPVRISFTADSGMFFLDDVSILSSGGSSGIDNVEVNPRVVSDNRIFSIDGRYLGTDFSVLPKGIYIRNGKKIVK